MRTYHYGEPETINSFPNEPGPNRVRMQVSPEASVVAIGTSYEAYRWDEDPPMRYHHVGTQLTFRAIFVEENVPITQTHWDFGDGTEAVGELVTHTYEVAIPGVIVHLRTTDENGRKAYASMNMMLTNAALIEQVVASDYEGYVYEEEGAGGIEFGENITMNLVGATTSAYVEALGRYPVNGDWQATVALQVSALDEQAVATAQFMLTFYNPGGGWQQPRQRIWFQSSLWATDVGDPYFYPESTELSDESVANVYPYQGPMIAFGLSTKKWFRFKIETVSGIRYLRWQTSSDGVTFTTRRSKLDSGGSSDYSIPIKADARIDVAYYVGEENPNLHTATWSFLSVNGDTIFS